LKWLYLASRGPSIARENFLSEWKNHARLASRFADLVSYFDASTYCLLDTDSGGFEAAGILSLKNLQAIHAVLANPDAVATIHPDERRVFGNLIFRLSLAAEEEVLREGAAGGHGCLAFLRLLRGSQLADCWSGIRGVLSGQREPRSGVSRCVLNRVVPGVFASIHDYHAVIELYGAAPSELQESVAPLFDLPQVDPAASLRVQGRVVMNWAAVNNQSGRHQ
jgi:hypothetical protein